MKRILSLALCLALLLSAFTMPALADEQKVKLSILLANNENYTLDTSLPYIQQILDTTGVELDATIVHSDNLNQTVSLAMAASEPYDIMRVKAFGHYDYIDSGLVMPLNDLIDQYGPNLKKVISQKAWDAVTVDGKIYAIPYENVANKYMSFIRVDWLENLGFEVKDTYTLTEMKEILTAFSTKDPDGNGENDTYGHVGYQIPYPVSVYAFAGAFGGTPNHYYMNENNEFYFFNVSDGMRATMEYLHELWVAGALDPEFFVIGQDKAKVKTANGKAGFYSGWWSCTQDLANTGMVELNPDIEVKLINVTSDDGTVTGMPDTGFMSCEYLISSKCKNPEKAIQFLDFLASEEGLMLSKFGILDKDYTVTEDGGVVRFDETGANLSVLRMIINDLELDARTVVKPAADAPHIEQQKYIAKLEQYNPANRNLYVNVFYGLPTPIEVSDYKSDLDTHLNTSIVNFVTGVTEINDETWNQYVADWYRKGGEAVLQAWADAYNTANGTDYKIVKPE